MQFIVRNDVFTFKCIYHTKYKIKHSIKYAKFITENLLNDLNI